MFSIVLYKIDGLSIFLQFLSFKDLFIEKIMDKYVLKFWGKILSKKPHPTPTLLKNHTITSAFCIFN